MNTKYQVSVCDCILVMKLVNWIDYDVELSFKCFHTLVDSIFYIGQLDVVIIMSIVYILSMFRMCFCYFGGSSDECQMFNE